MGSALEGTAGAPEARDTAVLSGFVVLSVRLREKRERSRMRVGDVGQLFSRSIVFPFTSSSVAMVRRFAS